MSEAKIRKGKKYATLTIELPILVGRTSEVDYLEHLVEHDLDHEAQAIINYAASKALGNDDELRISKNAKWYLS